MGQLPFFLQRFRPKGLLGSASSYPSLFNPLPSASLVSPSYSSVGSLFGSSSQNFRPSSFGSLGLGSSPLSSTSFGPLNLGSSSLPSASFGSLSLGSSPLSSTSFGSSSFGSPNFAPSFAATNFATAFAPSSGSSSFSSTGLGNSLFSSSSSFGSPSLGYSPFSSASFNSPTIGSPSLPPPKFQAANFAPSSFSDFSTSGSFDGLGELDPIDLIEDYPGFSNAGFAKDLNFAGSQAIKYQSPPLGNEYSFVKRSTD
ncbi:hypothetical protein NPIL_276221 [Nephila pilipes]|uniref:Uncharacterized protein n=1 Tax=Nephila pilipes TaxID=299642 RepID=A0A8X6Q4S4_NEPPI|nr:hypothetical protein NPIL_276221 [Nephila pilipes]